MKEWQVRLGQRIARAEAKKQEKKIMLTKQSKPRVFDEPTRQRVLAEIARTNPTKNQGKGEREINHAVARAGASLETFKEWAARGMNAVQQGDTKSESARFYLGIRLAILRAGLRPIDEMIKPMVKGLTFVRKETPKTIGFLEEAIPELSALDPSEELDAVREDLRIMKLLLRLCDDLGVP